MQQQHEWEFFRAGGVDQVAIRSGADIAHLAELDQKLWVALACPTRGIEFDNETLDLIDTDSDGRIRAPELIAACEWAVAQVKDPEVLATGSDALRLDDLRDDTEAGLALKEEARRILVLAGRPEAHSVTLADVQMRLASLNAMPFNGDGILNPITLKDHPALAALAARIMEAYGPAKGSDGGDGLGRAQLDNFFTDVQAIADWHDAAHANTCSLSTHGQAVAAAKALGAVQAKVEDFFARTRLAAYDARALTSLNPKEEGYAAMAQQVLSLQDAAIAALPLAPVVANGALSLTTGINPAWVEAMQALREHAVQPLLGDLDSLTLAQWEQLKTQLAPCQKWLAAYPSSPLGAMTQDEARALLDSGMQAQLQHFIQHDEDEKEHSVHAVALHKLIRFQRDLLELLNNFVAFSRFYRREGAAFQAGTLFLDGRSCDLTVDVVDPAAHATLAGLAKVYLAYCECRRDGVKRHIVAAFTAGDVDFLFVGRNGIFYDRDGKDWDATITKLIENPTSIGQAFFSPYKKFLRMIEEQLAKRAAAKDASVTAGLDAQAAKLTDFAKNVPAAPSVASAGGARKTDVGTVAAIGVALGSISTVLVGIFGKFIELGPWIPVALVGLVLAISGPSMMIAWLKLRQRSLGPILDASGWAINGRMNINLQLGQSLSQTAKVPVLAKRTLNDPFADHVGVRWCWVALVVAVLVVIGAWRMHWLDRVLPASWQPAAPAPMTVPSMVPAPSVAAP